MERYILKYILMYMYIYIYIQVKEERYKGLATAKGKKIEVETKVGRKY